MVFEVSIWQSSTRRSRGARVTATDAVRTTEEYSRNRIANDRFERMVTSEETDTEKRGQNDKTMEMTLKN